MIYRIRTPERVFMKQADKIERGVYEKCERTNG
jgi:hypothetical protein